MAPVRKDNPAARGAVAPSDKSRTARRARARITELPARYEILITCEDEPQQLELLERLGAEGLTCRALVV